MFETKDNLINNFKKPMNLASMALDELTDRLGGTKVVADPNTPFCFLMEFGSSITASAIQAIDDKLPTLYAPRAQSMEDLFVHMSDFDYLHMYATPSSTKMILTLPKAYLISRAIEVNSNYKQLTIPRDTVFVIGRYNFGIYYPINILINSYSQTFNVLYDTSIANPLHSLTTNVVEKSESSLKGIDYISLTFPIYQFSKDTITMSLVAETGFSTKLTYNDQFYALRIFTYKDGEYIELHQTQSQYVYDINHPTALIQVLLDTNQVKISIPQIYFDDGYMGSKLEIELYTTLGALDISTVNIEYKDLAVRFQANKRETNQYNSVFHKLPFDQILQLAKGSKIIGGSNAIDVNDLRERIVNNTLYRTVPITENDIEVYLEDNGFYVKKYLDNVTDRIFYAYRVLTDETGAIIPSINMKMKMLATYANEYVSFLKQSDNSITVLPTTIYEYDGSTDDVTPLTNDVIEKIKSMNKEELVATLNENHYFRSPFHLCVDLSDMYPSVTSFNLMTPNIDEIIFDNENFDISSRMVTYDAVISHQHEGTGGYKLTLSVSKSDDLLQLSEDNLLVYLTVQTTDGYWIGIPVTYSEKLATRFKYEVEILTNYHLTLDDEIYITNLKNDSLDLQEYPVSLKSKFYLVYLVNKAAFNGNIADANSEITLGVPDEYLNTYVALDRQHLSITLGCKLNDVIRHNIEISSSQKQYARWEYNVADVYEQDVYEKDDKGQLISSVDENGHVVLNKIHSAGEHKRNEQGELLWKHRIGDIRYSEDGKPITVLNRSKIYYLDLMLIDAKVFASERTSETNFVKSIYRVLESYFTTIRNLQEQLLERTYVYFKCVRSTGTSNFNHGDGVTTKENIEMSFKILCYVPSYVKKNDDIQQKIIDLICQNIEDAIKTKTISMMDIFSKVQNKLGDYIDHFTLLGVNNNVTHQTFQILDEDAQPSIARKLELTEDNIISLKQQLDVSFVALNDNNETVNVSL